MNQSTKVKKKRKYIFLKELWIQKIDENERDYVYSIEKNLNINPFIFKSFFSLIFNFWFKIENFDIYLWSSSRLLISLSIN